MENVQTKHSVHDLVSDQIIDFLEQGIVPWQTTFASSEVPANLLTKRQYRGINVLLLAAPEYERNYFLTEPQIERIRAYVRRGQKPHIVIDGVGFRSLRPYEVYNVSQCEDIPNKLFSKPLPKREPLEIFKGILSKLDHSPRIVHSPELPYYLLSEDIMHMPPIDYIGFQHEFLALFYKQLIVMTQHESRLDRTELVEYASFDRDAFALEELIIEIGSWYLRSYTGIDVKMHLEPHYFQYWIERVKENSRLACTAAEMAQKAVEYVLGTPFNEVEAIDYVEDEMLPF